MWHTSGVTRYMTRSEAEQVVSRELEPGEQLLWAGAPRQGVLLRPSDALFIPFSLLWGGFAIFWEVSVLNAGAPLFFVLWGVPFVVVGLYLIVGRFAVEARQRSATAYALTNKRAVIVSGLLSRSVKSVELRGLYAVTLSERRDGSGSIVLGSQPVWGHWLAGSSWPGFASQLAPSFDLIDNANSVYAQLRAAQSAASAGAGQPSLAADGGSRKH